MIAEESQRELARLLRCLREATQMTMRSAGARIGMSESTMSRAETAKRTLELDEVEALLALYGASPEDRETALALLASSERDVLAWLEPYVGRMNGEYAEYARLESLATGITEYNSLVFPGLAQTEKYARAVTESSFGGGDELVEMLVEIRMRRQWRLAEEPPPSVTWIITEACLRVDVGGPHVMQEQLRHVADLAARPNITVCVVPFSTGARAAMQSGFTLFEYSGARDRSVVCDSASVASSIATEETAYVNRARGLLRRLLQAGLDEENSIRMIEDQKAWWAKR
ncbi:helix-turn-helix domain-containing protein [Embleya sp. NPDC020886]|uniref:helix-turn-helix domain-containing protein n=1 Tax=Embleya sp. NPDC020886 TaxID=3363980 RepID=UPI0037AD079E